MIPVFLMGVGAIYVRQIRAALGERAGIAIGILIIALACLARLWLSGGARCHVQPGAGVDRDGHRGNRHDCARCSLFASQLPEIRGVLSQLGPAILDISPAAVMVRIFNKMY